MPLAINIKVEGLTQAIDRLGNTIARMEPVTNAEIRSLAFRTKKNIITNAKNAFHHPRPQLIKNIKIDKRSKKGNYKILMPKYAWYAEMGTPAGKYRALSNNPQAKRWAKAAGINTYLMNRWLFLHGSKPHPFIRPAIYAAFDESVETTKKISKKILRGRR
jgi:hypothetical protein